MTEIGKRQAFTPPSDGGLKRLDEDRAVAAMPALALTNINTPSPGQSLSICAGALGGSPQKKEIFFGLPWNVIENKGPKMRKIGQMRLPWNVYENRRLNLIYPGMLLINIPVNSFWGGVESEVKEVLTT
jgi:hypothetical protein